MEYSKLKMENPKLPVIWKTVLVVTTLKNKTQQPLRSEGLPRKEKQKRRNA